MAKAIDWLSRPDSGVSCHYGIDEDGRITQMVAEDLRAWHAGESIWDGETDINSASIGIEIHNPGHDFGYPDFPEMQMQAVEALSRDIIARHGIRPERVLAHSDVAPTRKRDPGEKFPWARLAARASAIGSRRRRSSTAEAGIGVGAAGPLIADVQVRAARLWLRDRADRRDRRQDRVRRQGLPAPLPPRARRRPHRQLDHRHARAPRRRLLPAACGANQRARTRSRRPRPAMPQANQPEGAGDLPVRVLPAPRLPSGCHVASPSSAAGGRAAFPCPFHAASHARIPCPALTSRHLYSVWEAA